MEKKKILIIFGYYLPGFKAGGPVQTIKNLTDVFGEEYSFFILTLNHDMGETDIYFNISSGWNQVGNAKVLYVPDSQFNAKTIINVAEQMDMIYACSLFATSTISTIFAKHLGKIKCPVAVAPMGVFSKGAIAHNKTKKQVFLHLFKGIGAFKNITWSLSSNLEKNDLENNLGIIDNYVIAEDIPRKPEPEALVYIEQTEKKDMSESVCDKAQFKPAKCKGKLNVIFLSRISPMKNLLGALHILNHPWNGKITFDIYGTKEDQKYYEKCEEQIQKMDPSVKVNYCGEAIPEDVPKIFSSYDVFLFPTLGENYGHVIYEAMASGCVPFISDTTIWEDFDKNNCGSILNLYDIDGFRTAINEALDAGEEWRDISCNAIRYAENRYNSIINNSGYIRLFDNATSPTGY